MTSPKLLLVEDDESLAELLEYRFAKEGYRVRVTAYPSGGGLPTRRSVLFEIL